LNWTKFGDEYPVEARELTDAEWRTHGEALMWSNFRLLDLHIPKKDVRRFAEYDSDVPLDDIIVGLVAKKWWRDDGDEWYVGLVHPEWQRDSDEVLADRAKAAARMKRIRRHKAGDHALCSAATCDDSPVRANVHPNGHANVRSMFADPDPTRPDPVLLTGRPVQATAFSLDK
jgi:hypothetical protein